MEAGLPILRPYARNGHRSQCLIGHEIEPYAERFALVYIQAATQRYGVGKMRRTHIYFCKEHGMLVEEALKAYFKNGSLSLL